MKHRTCKLFSKQEEPPQVSPRQEEQNGKCGCGREKRSHSYVGLAQPDNGDEWTYGPKTDTTEIKTFGVLYNSYEQCRTKVI